MNKDKKIYEKIIKIIKDNKLNDEDDTFSITSSICRKYLCSIILKEKYDLDVFCRDIRNADLNNLNVLFDNLQGDVFISKFGKNKSFISNIEKQPNDEILFAITLPTGAYIFGNDYDEELFNEFFEELKLYDYKYIDEINHSLYFELDKSSNILKEYTNIYNKYDEKHSMRSKQRKIDYLKKQLEQLEKGGK